MDSISAQHLTLQKDFNSPMHGCSMPLRCESLRKDDGQIGLSLVPLRTDRRAVGRRANSAKRCDLHSSASSTKSFLRGSLTFARGLTLRRRRRCFSSLMNAPTSRPPFPPPLRPQLRRDLMKPGHVAIH